VEIGAMINVGFVGLGGMGLGQVKAFSQVKGCRIAAGSDPSDAAQKRFAEQYPGTEVYSDYRQLLKNTAIDAVVVVTPTLYHKDVAIAAMKAGRAVLSEKPLARTVADCRKMMDVEEKTKKLLMVAHCRRFDTDWGCFADIIKSNTLGGPVLWRHANAYLINFGGPWFMDDKLSGGPLLDGAVHNYDFANMLFGDPETVLASSIKLTTKTAMDTATAVVRYKTGNQLMVCWTWGVTSAGLIDVLGSNGSLQWGPGDYAKDGKLDTQKFGYYVSADPARKKTKLHKYKRTDMYVTQAKHFIDCVEGKAKCLTPTSEAIKAVAVGEAVLKAAPSGSVKKVSW